MQLLANYDGSQQYRSPVVTQHNSSGGLLLCSVMKVNQCNTWCWYVCAHTVLTAAAAGTAHYLHLYMIYSRAWHQPHSLSDTLPLCVVTCGTGYYTHHITYTQPCACMSAAQRTQQQHLVHVSSTACAAHMHTLCMWEVQRNKRTTCVWAVPHSCP